MLKLKKMNFARLYLFLTAVLCFLVLFAVTLTACDFGGNQTNNDNSGQEPAPEPLVPEFDFELSDDGAGYIVVSTINTKNVTAVSIPDEYNGKPVVGVADNTFRDCENLVSVQIPDSVKSIGKLAFQNCPSLKSVSIGRGVETLGKQAFGDCHELKDVNINAASLQGYNYDFFGQPFLRAGKNCGGMDVMFGDSVEYIPNFIFSSYYDNDNKHQTYIDHLRVSDKVENVGETAFWDIDFINHIEAPVTVASKAAEDNQNTVQTVTVTSGTELTKSDFQNCQNLRSVTLPADMTTIASGVFYGCDLLDTITVAEDNPVYHSSNNCIIESATKTLVAGSNTAVIPTDGSVTKIADSAFYARNSLKTVAIPDSVTHIGESAFYRCEILEKVTLGKGLIDIGADALRYCDMLDSVFYNGTLKEWDDVVKGKYWNANSPFSQVVCSDGNITL